MEDNKSFFIQYFGDTPQLRIIDFFIENHFFDFPITEICREAKVSYNSFKVFLPKFLEDKILIKTRRIGKSDYYKLNLNNSFVKNLIKLDWILTKRNVLNEELVEA